jgi:hypothetical protein
MRGLAVLGFFVAVLASTPALAQAFVGDWTATAHTPGGDFSETLNVTKVGDGYAVKAKLSQPLPAGTPEAGPGENIVVKGNDFSYSRSVTAGSATLKVEYSGVVSGDDFTGTVELGGTQYPYTGVRIKPGQ